MAYAEDNFLTDEELETFNKYVDQGFWPRLTLEDIIGTSEVDAGTVSIVKDKFDGIASPERIAESGYFPKDRIKRYTETLYVEERGIGFDIPKKTIDIFRTTGRLINQKYLVNCGRRLAESVETISLAKIQTLASTAENTFTCSSDGSTGKGWDESGLDPYADVLEMLALIDANGYEADTLWIDKTFFRTLQKKDTHGDRIIDDIKTVIPNIVGSFNLSSATGVLMDSTQFEFIYSQRPNVLSDFRSANRMYESSVAYEGVLDVEDIDACLTLDLS